MHDTVLYFFQSDVKLRLLEAKHQEEKLMMQQRHDADVEKVRDWRVLTVDGSLFVAQMFAHRLLTILIVMMHSLWVESCHPKSEILRQSSFSDSSLLLLFVCFF